MGSERLFEGKVAGVDLDPTHLIVAGAALAAIAGLVLKLSIAKRARRALSGRTALPAEEFAALFDSEKERAVAVAIRDRLRRYIAVDPALVRPDDKLCEQLQLAAADGLDANQFVMEVEKIAGVKIPDVQAADMRTLRDIVSYVAARK